ncbi:MAG: hypothetical protein ABJ370_00005 [Paracoccaceae bacterium]
MTSTKAVDQTIFADITAVAGPEVFIMGARPRRQAGAIYGCNL